LKDSSRRFKENITEMRINNPIEIVSSVKPRVQVQGRVR